MTRTSSRPAVPRGRRATDGTFGHRPHGRADGSGPRGGRDTEPGIAERLGRDPHAAEPAEFGTVRPAVGGISTGNLDHLVPGGVGALDASARDLLLEELVESACFGGR
jgi:hypothetical protein